MVSGEGPGFPRLRTNQGTEVPQLGLGVFQSPKGAPTRQAVRWALQAGYRHIDTASFYGNEEDVGEAVRESGLPREEVFVTSKLWFTEHGTDRSQRAARESLKRLGLGYIDLYLIHWPRAERPQDRLDSWKGLEKLQREGVCRTIGVSNYAIRHLEELEAVATVRPAVDQVEYHPFVHDPLLLDHCRRRDIRVEAWSPLTRGRHLDHPTVVEIARAHGRSPAQVLLRWGIQHELIVLPKSVRQERIVENSQIFDFRLAAGEVARLDALAGGERIGMGGDPANIP